MFNPLVLLTLLASFVGPVLSAPYQNTTARVPALVPAPVPAPAPVNEPVYTHFVLLVRSADPELDGQYVGFRTDGAACIRCPVDEGTVTTRFLGWINATETEQGWLVPYYPLGHVGKLRRIAPTTTELWIAPEANFDPGLDISGNFERSRGALTYGGFEYWSAVPDASGAWSRVQVELGFGGIGTQIRLIPICRFPDREAPCLAVVSEWRQ
ncbi:hypothetical protein EDC01DRAFT_777996 [Geopyxis carbonaria]|nr:hypothetical protein EDC01DRAFT_777996 [Geopyxis carbonaria]